MAPPNFPNGMTLQNIGFAALKYPALNPEPLNVPLGNLVGALQHQPPSSQNHQAAQIASQFLPSLLEYQTSDEPSLHDPSLPQYYFSTVICLLNYLSMNPDVSKRIAAHPNLLNNVIEKLLAPNFVDEMKAVPRPGGAHFPAATFDDDFGSLLQFLSTMLLYRDQIGTLHPRINELIPKMRVWKQQFRKSRTKTISAASERLVGQIQGMNPGMMAEMRTMMEERTLRCGVATCRVHGSSDLTVCATCRIQRYCGRDHQKTDWRYHKHICNKGLEERTEV